jgi:outer membrane receptor protein involved in Fe transport
VATWTGNRATLFTALDVRGETLDAEPAFGAGGGLYRNEGRRVIDVGGALHLTRHVQFFGRVTNLFDRAYEEVLGYRMPGRMLFAGVRVAAGR